MLDNGKDTGGKSDPCFFRNLQSCSTYETVKEESATVLVCVMNKLCPQERRTHCKLKLNDQGSLVGTIET